MASSGPDTSGPVRPSQNRVGLGYDVHRLVPGRPLVLGGVQVPFDSGLEAHSDGDVLVHAIMDALLGAAGLKDIGVYFPDTDPQYRGISSLALLERVKGFVQAEGWEIVNIDSCLVAERPRLSPFIDTMKANIGGALGVGLECIGLKVTTNEGLGSVGRGEGMVGWAVALITKTSPK